MENLSASATLRRVIELREREQELVIVGTVAARLSGCPGCGGRLSDVGEALCSKCRKQRVEIPRPAFVSPPMPEDPFTTAVPPVVPATTKESHMEAKTCSRNGCGKSLRPQNVKGVCSSGCLSPDAPPFQRAAELSGITTEVRRDLYTRKNVEAPVTIAEERKSDDELELAQEKTDDDAETVRKFRMLTDALDLDADALIAVYCREWLENARKGVLGADDDEEESDEVADE